MPRVLFLVLTAILLGGFSLPAFAQQKGAPIYQGLTSEQVGVQLNELRASNAALGAQITGLESDKADLNGKLETLQFLLSQSRDQINDMQADDAEIGRLIGRLEGRLSRQDTRMAQLEAQLRSLQSRLGQTEETLLEQTAQAAPSPTTSGTPRSLAGARTVTRTESRNAPDSTTSATLAQTKPSESDVDTPVTVQSTAQTSTTRTLPQGSLGTIPASALPGEAGPLFALAKSRLLQFNYSGAEEAFRAFLTQFGDDPQAGEAQYWLAEVLYQQEAYPESGQAYTTMIRTYPDDPRAPEALAKLARSMRLVGEMEKACNALDLLPQRYPNASGVTQNLAAGERVRAGCES